MNRRDFIVGGAALAVAQGPFAGFAAVGPVAPAAGRHHAPGLAGHASPPPPKKPLRIRPAEAAHVKFVRYRDPSGYFFVNVPAGWRVRTGLKPDGKIDLISYAITVFDPKRPER